MQDKKLLLAMASGFAAMLLNAPSFAAMSIPDGWYVDANVGSTHLSNKSYPGSSSSSGIGGNADVGYKFMPYFGLELGYTRYANTSIKNQQGTIAGYDRHYSYDLAAKGILPFGTTGFEALAKLGVGRNSSSVSRSNATAANSIGLTSSQSSDTNVYIAAGVQYDFLPELAGVLQWARMEGSSSTGNLDLFTLGVNFILG